MSIKKFRFSKLVRDKTPQNLKEEEVKINYISPKNHKEILSYYKQKLLEEAQEVSEAKNTHELIDEIADCLEVIKGLSNLLEIDAETIEQARQEKFKKRGGFNNKVLIESIELPSFSSWLGYFLKDPKKYPEIID